MSQLYFKIDGLTKKESRRWKKHTQPSVVTAKILVWCTVAATVIYSTGAKTPIAEIDGKIIKGENVLVIRDVSDSMKNSSYRQEKLKKHLASLEDSGMVLNNEKYEAYGFGVSTSDNDNLLMNIKNGLEKDSDVDTVYAFSDFEETSRSYWESNDDGYQRLEKLLKENGVSLYLGTVMTDPPEKLIEIAKKSGGDLIISK